MKIKHPFYDTILISILTIIWLTVLTATQTITYNQTTIFLGATASLIVYVIYKLMIKDDENLDYSILRRKIEYLENRVELLENKLNIRKDKT